VLAQAALLKAIKCCGSKQKRLADLIGESPDKISYWLNRAKQIPFHVAIAIESATEGAVSRYDLAPYARFNQHSLTKEPQLPAPQPPVVSERAIRAMQLERTLGNRQGTRTDLADKASDPLGRKCPQVKGKTTTLAAKEAGFHSRDTYLRAKKVVQTGVFQLVQAMDQGRISVSQAAMLADLPPAEQEIMLLKEKKEMLAIIKNKKRSSPHHRKQPSYSPHSQFPFATLLQEAHLIQAEATYKLPLRLPYIGLILRYAAVDYFPWQPAQLLEELLPHVSLDFEHVLIALEKIGLIGKEVIDGKAVGKILWK